MRRERSLITLVIVLALSTGCSSPTPEDSESAFTTPRPSPTTKALGSTPSPTPTENLSDVADKNALQDAIEVATAALGEFAAHDREYDQWWAGLSPYLDPVALSDYAYTNPRLVPVSVLIGEGTVQSSPSATEATVLIPTDVGDYRVVLYRQASEAGFGPWQVNSLTPLVSR